MLFSGWRVTKLLKQKRVAKTASRHRLIFVSFRFRIDNNVKEIKMFALSFCVFAGVLFMMIKLPHRLLLRMLKYDALIDLAVSALVLFLYWGSFEGGIVAAVAGLLTSIATSGAKRLFGYIDGGVYHHGYMRPNVEARK